MERGFAVRVVVTGAAGFIGSRLCASLLQDGLDVIGVDSLTDYYNPQIKRENLAPLLKKTNFTMYYDDLLDMDLSGLLAGVSTVFHLAGQPGVRDSWDEQFPVYVDRNIVVTHRLLDAAKGSKLERFVYSSSSSIYGQSLSEPTPESVTPLPRSPYGVTKLAAEQICGAYANVWGVPTISLRYFTVFGGGQRPDMALNRMISVAKFGGVFEIFGDGEQRRDFTHVLDVVQANRLAASVPLEVGSVFNVAGGVGASVNELIDLVGDLSGKSVTCVRRPVAAGDVRTTSADVSRAREMLGWQAKIGLTEGVAEQIEWATAAMNLARGK